MIFSKILKVKLVNLFALKSHLGQERSGKYKCKNWMPLTLSNSYPA